MFNLKCYSYGRFVGTVTAHGRKWRVGRAAYWVATTESGRWVGSYHTRDEAESAVFYEAGLFA